MQRISRSAASRVASFGLATWMVLGLAAGCGEDGPKGPAPVADSSPLGHLTNEQYAHTVRDLFPGVPMPEFDLPVQFEAAGGFENNTVFMGPTAPFVEAHARAARAVSEALSLAALDLECASEDPSCAHAYVASLGERAWRRELSEAERGGLVADYDSWAAAHGAEVALQLSVQSLLQSPDFLYFVRFGSGPSESASGSQVRALSSWELASRLSYFLWNTMPDAELFELARSETLGDPEVLEAQARRMLADPRAREAVADLHRQLLDLDELGTLDLEYYGEALDNPSPTDYYVHYLQQVRYEPEVFIIQHVFEGEGTLASILSSNRAWVTEDTARIAYGVEIPPDAASITYATPLPVLYEQPERTFYEVELDPTQRAGVFTLANFLSANAGPRQPSPVQRGVLLIERLQCQELSLPGDVPPLEDVDTFEPKTNRDKYQLHTAVPTCQGCHEQIDGLGFTFEHYDSLGAWRELDNGYPVDASGEVVGTDVDGPVEDAVALMRRLAESRTIHDCYVRQLYRYAFARPERSADSEVLTQLQDDFWTAGGDIQALLVALATSEPFRYRELQP